MLITVDGVTSRAESRTISHSDIPRWRSRRLLFRGWTSGLRLFKHRVQLARSGSRDQSRQHAVQLVHRPDDDSRLALLKLQDPEAASNRQHDVPEFVALPPWPDPFGPFSYNPIALRIFASTLDHDQVVGILDETPLFLQLLDQFLATYQPRIFGYLLRSGAEGQ